MDNSLQRIIDEQQVARANAAQLIEAFGAPFTEAGAVLSTYKELVVTDESQKDLMADARKKRLILKGIRTGVENKRKELKEDSLRTGKAIDGVARYIRETIQPAEEYLELQEKFAEIKAAERLAALKAERIAAISNLTSDVSPYNLEAMTDESFTALVASLKLAKEAQIAQELAAKEASEKAEAERVAEEKRVRAENERLRAEADEREKEMAAQRALAEAERLKREQLENEQRLRDEALAKEKADQAEADRQALLAPDKEKLIKFRDALETIRSEKLPIVQTKPAQAVVDLIDEMLVKMQTTITDKANQL